MRKRNIVLDSLNLCKNALKGKPYNSPIKYYNSPINRKSLSFEHATIFRRSSGIGKTSI